MKKRLQNLYLSFPVQLLVIHLRNNHLLLLFWGLNFAIIFGLMGNRFGLKYLLLNPEYLGRVSFYSFFIVGLAFGGFLMTWNITIYILNSYRFPFLASLEKPFTKFCLNNGLLPLVYFGLYLIMVFNFQWYNETAPLGSIVLYLLGYLSGFVTILLLYALYFQVTNKDAPNLAKVGKIKRGFSLGWLKVKTPEFNHNWPVKYYLTERVKWRLVRNVEHYPPELLEKVYRQNHVNAAIVQVTSIMILLALGALIEHRMARIPAGASLFILFGVLISLVGGVSYWFRSWRNTVFILIFIAMGYASTTTIMTKANKAYGLDYKKEAVPYNYAHLDSLHNEAQYMADVKNTERILDKWRQKFPEGRLSKPKMVIVTSSGGGIRQAVWAMQVMQEADSLMDGDLFKHTSLITGASGGMLGAAYMREVYLQSQIDESVNPYDRRYTEQMGSDRLNSIIFTGVSSDLLLPWMTFKYNGHRYNKDRGYIMERELAEYSNGWLDKPLRAYREVEAAAVIPMLFVTPVVVNDARRLVISPQGVSYMAKTKTAFDDRVTSELDAVDFGLVFKEHDGGDLAFTSALRMNSTYPYVLPNAHLPTYPDTEVMDAGWRDNFGIESATRFIDTFSGWIKENCSGVVIVQIRGSDKVQKITTSLATGIFERAWSPINIAGLSSTQQDYMHDHLLNYTREILGENRLEVLHFVYRPSKQNERASMSFHLTSREKNDIMNAIYHPENQENLRRLKEIVR